MEALTPAPAEDLPPIGELLVDDPFWLYPAWGLAREGAAHLRIWATVTATPGYIAVVTDTDGITSVAESAGRIWADLARRYGPSLVLLEHHLTPGSGEGAETLDLVRIGADGSPHWTRVWPTPQDNPRHAGLELWMAAHGYQIVDGSGLSIGPAAMISAPSMSARRSTARSPVRVPARSVCPAAAGVIAGLAVWSARPEDDQQQGEPEQHGDHVEGMDAVAAGDPGAARGEFPDGDPGAA